MTDHMERWLLGEGSYVINSEASVDTLLNDACEWLRHASFLAETINNQVSRTQMTDSVHINHMLSTIRVFTRMSMQCVRMVRRELVWHEDVPGKT